MATTTPNYGWVVPTSTDLVKDGATAIETLGDSIDASFVGLKGGTTGQVLSKTSGTDLAFTWIANDTGDITGITTGVSSGLTGGVTSGTADLSLLLNFNSQTGTTYTLVAADANKLVTSSNASAVTITVPPSVFSAGQMINVQSIGVGLTSFAQGSGVTITSTGATASAPTLRARYSACTIICTASNTFTILGDLS
jgi:hypothetical protein